MTPLPAIIRAFVIESPLISNPFVPQLEHYSTCTFFDEAGAQNIEGYWALAKPAWLRYEFKKEAAGS